MKAEQLNAPACSPAHTLDLVTTSRGNWGLAAWASSPTSKSPLVITDQDLARAAYTQAVVLRDSCVQYAMATRPTARVQRSQETIAAKRGR